MFLLSRFLKALASIHKTASTLLAPVQGSMDLIRLNLLFFGHQPLLQQHLAGLIEAYGFRVCGRVCTERLRGGVLGGLVLFGMVAVVAVYV